MRYYKEDRIEKANRLKAAFITASLYFLLFTGVFFATQPEKLPDFVKDLLKIEKVEKQVDQKVKDRA